MISFAPSGAPVSDFQGRRTVTDEFTAYVRACYVPAHNFRISSVYPGWMDVPLLRAVVFEVIDVEPKFRRQGVCKRVLAAACDDPRYDLVVVEGVGNPILAAALIRWGWDWDAAVTDFYWRRAVPTD